MAKRGTKNNSISCEDAEFFKVFLPDLHSQQLMIPPDYMKYFSRTIRERIILKDTGGKTWHVTVEKTRDGVFLKNGWQRFVNHHLLSLGEFLVFKYDKSFSFLVKIYGINGCKKEISVANDDITTRVKVEENDTEEEMTEKQTLGKRARPHNKETNVSLDSSEEETNSKQTLCKRASPFNKETGVSSDSTECPFFVSPLSHLKQYRVQIPKEVLMGHNVDIESEMVLRDENGKEWEVNTITFKDGRVYIGKGWSQFRTDNNLVLKDCCRYTFGAEKSSRVIRVQVLRDGLT